MTRILVVDDQRDVRTMICMVLRVKHFEVVEAGSAMREKVLELPVVAISGMTSFDAASHSVELSGPGVSAEAVPAERSDRRHRSGAGLPPAGR